MRNRLGLTVFLLIGFTLCLPGPGGVQAVVTASKSNAYTTDGRPSLDVGMNKVNLEWGFDKIKPEACQNANASNDGKFCDGTQNTIGLLHSAQDLEKYTRFLIDSPPQELLTFVSNLKLNNVRLPYSKLARVDKEQLFFDTPTGFFNPNKEYKELYYIDRKQEMNGFIQARYKKGYNSDKFKADLFTQVFTVRASNGQAQCKNWRKAIEASFIDIAPEPPDPCESIDVIVVFPTSLFVDPNDPVVKQDFSDLRTKNLDDGDFRYATTFITFANYDESNAPRLRIDSNDNIAWWKAIRVITTLSNTGQYQDPSTFDYIRAAATKWRSSDLPGFDPSIDLTEPFLGFETQATTDDPTHSVNLIQDNYSPAFKQDFSSTYGSDMKVLAGRQDLTGSLLDVKNWQFSVNKNASLTSVNSGIFDVQLDGTAQFSPQGISFKETKVNFSQLFTLAEWDQRTKITILAQNPLLYLPFDGAVGVGNAKGRADYGVGITFSREPQKTLYLASEPSFPLQDVQGGFVQLKVEPGETVADTQDGRLVELSGHDRAFDLKYSPSAPVKLDLTTTTPNELYYGLVDVGKAPPAFLSKADYGGTDHLYIWNDSQAIQDQLVGGALPAFCSGLAAPQDLVTVSLTAPTTQWSRVSYAPLDSILGLACAQKNLSITAMYFDATKSVIASIGSAFQAPIGNNPTTIPIGIYSAKDPQALQPVSLATFVGLSIKGQDPAVSYMMDSDKLVLRWNLNFFHTAASGF